MSKNKWDRCAVCGEETIHNIKNKFVSGGKRPGKRTFMRVRCNKCQTKKFTRG